jgi:hypothetical protein
MKQLKALERLERIKQLGAFGKKKTQIVKDKSKYTRKSKYNVCGKI